MALLRRIPILGSLFGGVGGKERAAFTPARVQGGLNSEHGSTAVTVTVDNKGIERVNVQAINPDYGLQVVGEGFSLPDGSYERMAVQGGGKRMSGAAMASFGVPPQQ